MKRFIKFFKYFFKLNIYGKLWYLSLFGVEILVIMYSMHRPLYWLLINIALLTMWIFIAIRFKRKLFNRIK